MYESMKSWNNKRKLNDFYMYIDFVNTLNTEKKAIIKFFKQLNKINISLLSNDDLKKLGEKISETHLVYNLSDQDVTNSLSNTTYTKMVSAKDARLRFMHDEFIKEYIRSFTKKPKEETQSFIKLSVIILKQRSDILTTFKDTFAQHFQTEFYGTLINNEKKILKEHINNDYRVNKKRL